jgi:DMSO/TMAO reductase YedYZ molybdopterin-dependent catalytic subunit
VTWGQPHTGDIGRTPFRARRVGPHDLTVMYTPAQWPDDQDAAARERTAANAPPQQPADLGSVGHRQAERARWRRRLRLQRRLHDGASLQISALVPQLGVVRKRLSDDEHDLRLSIDDLQDQLHTALQELREVAREIYPPLLDEAGLGPALCEFADLVAVPLHIVGPAERFCLAVEGAAYFAITDCLALLEAGGPPAEVVLRRDGEVLVIVLDGVPARHAVEMLAEVRGLGGEVSVAEASGAGRIEVRIPCE